MLRHVQQWIRNVFKSLFKPKQVADRWSFPHRATSANLLLLPKLTKCWDLILTVWPSSGLHTHLSWLSCLSKHGKSSFILAIHKVNIVAHAVDDQSSNTFLCGKSWAIWVAQHSLATWPECCLEPSSHSGCTLFLHCSTTLIWRNFWKGPCWHSVG